MTQSNVYTQLIKDALSSYVRLENRRPDIGYNVTTVFDDESQHYLVLEVGWQNSKRVQNLILHVALRDGKIWIEEDWTEDGIATYFLNHGVPNDQIVLGFQAPNMRPYTEFAVA